jgi:threonyl-tRNA synthetase
VIPVADVHNEYAQEVHAKLMAAGFRSEVDTSSDSMGKKVRNAKKDRLPYFLIIGDKDIEANTVTVESRDTGESVAMSTEDLLAKLTAEASV